MATDQTEIADINLLDQTLETPGLNLAFLFFLAYSDKIAQRNIQIMRVQEGERTFSNPNYRPEEWRQPTKKPDGHLTGISVIDAANELSKKVVIDALTGCLNRSYYENSKWRFDAQRAENAEIALIFIDLNGLKSINDNFGHAKGDEVICKLACLLKTKFRKSDEIVRLGGDEFLIICHNHDKDQQFGTNLEIKATEVQMNFKECLKTENMPSNGFAAGVAVFNKNTDSSLDDVLMRADKLMYKNKKLMKRTASISDII